MKFLVFAAFVVVFTAAEEFTPEQCGENEIWTNCSSSCEPSCFQRSAMCNMMCNPAKCVCQVGFLRDPMGRCVAPAQCPAVDPPMPQ